MSLKPRLFSPGPVDVAKETYDAMCGPTIGHRGKDFEELYSSVQPSLQQIAQTSRPVFLNTSSAWGAMEGALRNLTQKKVLNLCCGAFSDKWYDVALRCGKEAEKVQVEWGQPITPDLVREKLSEGGFDTVTLVHNETSTGVLNPLAEIVSAIREFDDIMIVVDTVSSFSAVPTAFDELGIDVLLCGVQKALALPPGLSLLIVSEAALERSKQLTDRGYYFDFHEFEKNHKKNNTPSTPAIPHIYGLKERVDFMLAEGLEARYARHEATNALTHEWVAKHGFVNLAPEGYQSKTLTCVQNNKEIDVPGFVKAVREKHNFLINGGYGKIKGTTFRISNMGNETIETQAELLAALDDVIPSFL